MKQSIQRTKKQKLLILLPIFLIGIAGLIFACINIMKKPPKIAPDNATKSALNKKLPSPELPVKQKNKLETYMEAARDSARKQAEWEKDPNSKRFYDPAPSTVGYSSRKALPKRSKSTASPRQDTTVMDPNEKKVNERLEELYAALDQSAKTRKMDKTPSALSANPLATVSSPETERLEKLLQDARRPDTAADPTLDRVEKILDKMRDIQHPERLNTGTDGTSSAPISTGYPVSTQPIYNGTVDYPETTTDDGGSNSFYGLEPDTQADSSKNVNTIQAVVPEDQTLQNGATIKLRLMQNIYIGSHRIPANNFIYGTCTVNNQRLQVQLTSAVDNNEILPISLNVYDLDGLEGIFVPGAVTRDVTKEGISQGISGMGIMSLEPSLGAQAAAAGIQTAKTLLSKKVKAVIVKVRAGHRVLLQPTHTSR